MDATDPLNDILDGDEYAIPVEWEERNVKTGETKKRTTTLRVPRKRELEELDRKDNESDIAKYGVPTYKRVYFYCSIFDVETDEKLRRDAAMREQRIVEHIRDWLETHRELTLRDVQETFLRSDILTNIVAIRKRSADKAFEESSDKRLGGNKYIYNNKRALCEYTYAVVFGDMGMLRMYFASEEISSMIDNLERLEKAGHILTEEKRPEDKK